LEQVTEASAHRSQIRAVRDGFVRWVNRDECVFSHSGQIAIGPFAPQSHESSIVRALWHTHWSVEHRPACASSDPMPGDARRTGWTFTTSLQLVRLEI